MSTSAGWDGVLNGIIDEEDCTKDNHETGEAGNCGNTAMGIAFLLSYLVISFLIIINMYIAVILENYSQVHFMSEGQKVELQKIERFDLLINKLIITPKQKIEKA
jgi:hypothetical protein